MLVRRRMEAIESGTPILDPLIQLALQLEQNGKLISPNARLFAQIEGPLSDVPAQYTFPPDRATDPFWKWLDVATLIEYVGEPELAHVVIHHLIDRIVVQSTGACPTISLKLGLCYARLGRISRTMGSKEAARAWYADAIRVGARGTFNDAKHQGMLGMATLAVAHGNFPHAERWLERLLRLGDVLPTEYRVPALQQLAMTRRKRGFLVDAMLHSWAAYDLLTADDPRSSSLRVTMAEIALELRAYPEAANAVRPIIFGTEPPRTRVPAMVVGLRLQLAAPEIVSSWKSAGLDLSIESECMLQSRIAPSDAVALRIALADIAMHRYERAKARELLTKALSVALAHDFHERVFSIEERLAAAEGSLQVAPYSKFANSRQAHPAVSRLMALV
jgi:hypothetical protein